MDSRGKGCVVELLGFDHRGQNKTPPSLSAGGCMVVMKSTRLKGITIQRG